MTTTRMRLAAVLTGATTLAACGSSTTTGTGQAVAPAGSSAAASTDASAPVSSEPAAPSTSTSTSPAIPAPATPLETHTVHSGSRTYVVQVWVRQHTDDCVAHAHGGPIIAFLKAHTCTGLDRVLATTTVDGRPVAYAESSTGFTGTPSDPYANAAKFKRLELADNTGSLNDLLSEGYRLPSGPTSIPAAEAFTVIGQDNGVAVWDLWYLAGSTPSQDKALLQVVTDLYLQF